MKFTTEQQLAIDKEGTNIIVSAGAGSGKTAVLTERVIRKLKSGVDIDKLLILTFTNEAASEMKNRIREAIIKNNLDNQLNKLESSYITTFDSYALSLVKKYHYLLNINKDIKIIDSSIITIYKYKTLDTIFENKYGDTLFNKLINDFCNKDDYYIKELIINIDDKLNNIVNKEEYLNNYIKTYYSSKYIDKLIKKYLELLDIEIKELNNIYNNLIYYCNDKLAKKITEWLNILFINKEYNNLVLFNTIPTVRFTGLNEEGIPLKEELKEKISKIKNLLRFKDIDEIKESILKTKDYAKVIIDIIKELDEKINIYKNKHNVFEFNDISNKAIEIVKDYPEIKEEIKENFNEIMIDEYQDTSDIQETFISYIENNNVYMVGDIKQSIYRFRNANPYIFQDKYNKYSKNIDGIKIDLNKNFRSRKETINNINEIFNRIMDNDIGNANYKEEHNMIYGNTTYDECTLENSNMEIYNYEVNKEDKFTKEEKELFIISEDINNLISNKYQVFDKKTNSLRDIKYSDICIITDRNKHLDTYKKILEYNKIPSIIYMDEELTNNTTILVIKNLINLVALVNNNDYSDKFRYLFTSIARSFIFNYDDNKIFNILKNKTYYEDNIISLCKEIDINLPLPEIINNILNTFDIYIKLTNLYDIEKNIVRINYLINISNDLSNLGYDMCEFIEYLDDTIKLNTGIKYSSNKVSENAVKIMNIHKSKGLEFSICYFTGMHNKFAIKDITTKTLFSSTFGIILPYLKDDELHDTIIKDLYTYNYYNEEISEKIRLFYVALTRTREKMIILANIDEEIEKYKTLVPKEIRKKYRSFLDIINSIDLTNYIVNKEAKCTNKYKLIKEKIILDDKVDIIINNKTINLEYKKKENKHFSKETNKLLDKDTIDNIMLGTNIHKIFEYADFKNPKDEYVINFLKQIDNNFINVYHEYSFSYEEDNNIYNGVIDLILEYNDHISIIDYKLKNISDNEYIKQLNGYKKYIEKITNKDVIIYLYSIMDNTLKEVNNEK